jgi:hypothetical protein
VKATDYGKRRLHHENRRVREEPFWGILKRRFWGSYSRP